MTARSARLGSILHQSFDPVHPRFTASQPKSLRCDGRCPVSLVQHAPDSISSPVFSYISDAEENPSPSPPGNSAVKRTHTQHPSYVIQNSRRANSASMPTGTNEFHNKPYLLDCFRTAPSRQSYFSSPSFKFILSTCVGAHRLDDLKNDARQLHLRPMQPA